jgi:glycosyltransferase involved in cell wall biosynthesis
MRILIDIRLLTRGGTTGIPGYTRDLVDTLITRHPEHEYILFYNALRKTQRLPETWYQAPHVRIINRNLPNRLLSILVRLTGWPTIETLTGVSDADLVWSPHLDLITTTKTPHVLTIHDLSFIHYPQFFSKKYHLWSWLQNQRGQVRNIKSGIAVSQFTKADISSTLGVPPAQISVVYSGIHRSFKPTPPGSPLLAAYREKHGITGPYLLSLCTLEPRKNIALLVEALAELKKDSRFKEHLLVIAGRPGYRADELQRLIAHSPVKDSICLIPEVSDEERVLLYGGARVFITPTFFEGFGFPALEAQACGTPVIASNRTSLPELLASSALFISPWSVTELVMHLRAIELSSEVRENIQAAGRANAARYTWEKAAQETLAVFARSARRQHP